MPSQPDLGVPPTPAEQKKTLLTLVAMVTVLDAIAIGAYHVFHIPDRPPKTQEVFVGGWVVATLIVIMPMMRRIRRARRQFRRR